MAIEDSLLDRVRETSATVGEDDIALLGAVEGFQEFPEAESFYCIENSSGQWEVGEGERVADTLVRTTILDGSAGAGIKVDFAAGVKQIRQTVPAAFIRTRISQAQADGIYSPLGHSHSFAELTAKPTTLAGYGITDAAPLIHIHDDRYYTEGEVDTLASGIVAQIITDHGALSGLADDDHTQYHNDARGDARYSLLTHTHAASDIASGTIATARLGSGVADNTTYLRGDQTWQTISAGITDHGALTGLGDDDHTIYALLAGRAGGQTLIGGTASGNNLTLQGSAHATKGPVIVVGTDGTNLQQWKQGSTTILSLLSAGHPYLISATGTLYFRASASLNFQHTGGGEFLTVLTESGHLRFAVASASPSVGLICDAAGVLRLSNASTGYGGLACGAADSAKIPLTVKGAASQSANLQEWQNSAGGILSTISENGYFTTRKVAAPADAELSASEVAFWFDDTNGAGKLKIKGKTANGTAVTGEVALA